MSHLSYTKLTTEVQLNQLRTFAESFDHQVSTDDLLFPILIVSYEDKWIGYVKIMNNMVGIAAWNPKVEVPQRVFRKAMEDIVAWAKINAALNNQIFPGFIAKGNDSAISDEFCEALGTVDTGFKLFSITR